jgi:hypothetical protein
MINKIKPAEKYLHCVHNINRHAANIANPYCNFILPKVDLPPHLYINVSHYVSEDTCRVCKVFKQEE